MSSLEVIPGTIYTGNPLINYLILFIVLGEYINYYVMVMWLEKVWLF